MRETNNYSNVFLPKTVDNTHRLALNGLRFQPDSGDHSGEFMRSIDENGEIDYASISGAKIYFVCSSFEDFGNYCSTVHKALALVSALNPSNANPYLIHLCPGVHVVTQKIIIPDGVTIEGAFQNSAIMVLAVPLVGAMITVETRNGDIYMVTINGNFLCDYIIEIGFNQVIGAQRLTITSAKIALIHSLQGGSFSLKNSRLIALQGAVTQYGALAESSSLLSLSSVTIFNENFPATIIGIGLNSSLSGSFFRSTLEHVTTIACGTSVQCINSELNVISGIFNLSNFGFNISGNSIVSMNGVLILSNVTDIITDADSELNTFGISVDSAKLSIADTDKVSINYFEEHVDQELGLHQLGHLVAGNKTFETTAFFGQGSFDFNGVVFCKYSTGLAVYTDVTDDLKPSGAGGVTVFDNATDVLYVGDEQKFYALESDASQIFDGTYSAQYFDGSTWVTFPGIMATDHDIPYSSCEDMIWSIAQLEDIRLTVQLGGSAYNWSKTTVDGTEKYWIRFTNLTLVQSPILDGLKLLYSSTKIDINGSILRFGNARTFQPIVYDLNLIRSPGSASTTPADQDLYFGASSRLGREQNKLGVGDIIGLSFFAPNNVDSSSPFRASIAFCSDSTAALQADFQVQITIGNVHDGDLIYFTQAAANGNPIRDEHQVNVNLTPNQTNGRYCVIEDLDLPIPFIRSRNIVGRIDELFSADITRISDSNGNDLVFMQVSLSFISWADGLSFVSL